MRAGIGRPPKHPWWILVTAVTLLAVGNVATYPVWSSSVVAPLVMAAAVMRLLFVAHVRLASAWLCFAGAALSMTGRTLRALFTSHGSYERSAWMPSVRRMWRSCRRWPTSWPVTGSSSSATDVAEAQRVAGRLVAALGGPYDIDGRSARIGVSLGNRHLGRGDSGPEQSLARADHAMYAAKACPERATAADEGAVHGAQPGAPTEGRGCSASGTCRAR